MPTIANTNPFRSELDPDTKSLYEERRKSRTNPFFSDINPQPRNENPRPNLNKHISDNMLYGATPRRTVQRSRTERNERVNYRHSVGVNELVQMGSSSHHHTHSHSRSNQDKKDRSRRHSKIPKELELDTIDKLDVTGIFSRGGFHHDGPYDAARPQRNLHYNKNAPIMAFPKNGSNNRMVRSHTISASSSEASISNPLTRKGTVSGQFGSNAKSKMIHGHASVGLGLTTFLDGAPASQEAIKEDIKNHIRRNKTIKDSRRKSIGNFLRGDFDFSSIPESHPSPQETKKAEAKKGNKFLRRVKSLRTAYRS